jgi:hypothetical protein
MTIFYLTCVDMIFCAKHIPEFQELTSQFHAGETRPCDDEVQYFRPDFRVGFLGGLPEHQLDMLPDPDGVFQTPERKGIFLNPRNAEELRLTAGGQYKVIVFVGITSGFNYLILEIDALDFIADHVDPLAAEDPFETDLHRFGLGSVPGNFVQFRHKRVVGIPVNEGNLHRLIFLERLIKGFDRVYATVPAAENDDFFRIAHRCLLLSLCYMVSAGISFFYDRVYHANKKRAM